MRTRSVFVFFKQVLVVRSLGVSPRCTYNHQIHQSIQGDDIVKGNPKASLIFTQSAENVYSTLVGQDDADITSTGDLLLGIEDIKQGWIELEELINNGELLPSELDQIYSELIQESSTSDKLNKKGFFTLYQSIEDLFEWDDQEVNFDDGSYLKSKDNNVQEESLSSSEVAIISSEATKAKILSYLDEMYKKSEVACGFEWTDKEREVIHHLIGVLEANGPSNLVLSSKHKKIDELQLMGEWDLRYTSSHAMVINKSLSGLGRSTSSKAQFEKLRKRLGGTKYLGKAEYVETFSGKEASFDVVVTGEWTLEEKRHAFTGMPSSSLRVDPETLSYGLTNNQASEWASLGPIKLLDIIYLDEDLMILRGNVNLKSFFIYERVAPVNL